MRVVTTRFATADFRKVANLLTMEACLAICGALRSTTWVSSRAGTKVEI